MKSINHMQFLAKFGSEAHLDQILNRPGASYYLSSMAKNPNLSQRHIERALTDSNVVTRGVAVQNLPLTPHQMDRAKQDKDRIVRSNAWYRHFGEMHVDDLMKVMRDPAMAEHHEQAFHAGRDNDTFRRPHLRELENHPNERVKSGAEWSLFAQ